MSIISSNIGEHDAVPVEMHGAAVATFDGDDDLDAQIAEWQDEVESKYEHAAGNSNGGVLPRLERDEWLRKLRAGRQEMAGRCEAVARQNTPPRIRVVTRNSLTTGHDAATRTIYVPNPVTRRALWAYLRQVNLANGYSAVWDAERMARRQMREAGIAVPRRRGNHDGD